MTIKNDEQDIKRALWWLLAISALVRCVIAATVEFGNDEVYYWTYALYPDWSHFDHPPMVGWMIQLFSLNLLFDSEFFIRLPSIVFMTVNTYLMFRIGKEIKDSLTGLYAALIYTASIYAFVITGIFILPDTPLSLFWLLAFWMAIKYFRAEKPNNTPLLLLGVFSGLAMLSKYTGAFIWVGIGIYMLFFDRKHFKNPFLYLSLLISAICCLPILYWNIQNDFVSLGFHSSRVSLFGKPNLSYLGTELAGEFFYNNPVNYVLAIVAVIAAFRGRIDLEKPSSRLILCTAIPLIVVFIFFSLTRPTLPHWNAPSFNLLILLTASLISSKHTPDGNRVTIPKPIIASMAVMVLTLSIGYAEIQTGFIPLDHHTEPEKLGRDDFTLDMYGWRQLEEKFATLREQTISEGLMKEEDGIIGSQWFPLANLDYYVARPLHMSVKGMGELDNIHKYQWITQDRGGFQQGEDYWFLSDSHYMKYPNEVFPDTFVSIHHVGTITIERGGRPVKNFFVYACKNLK